MILLGLAQIPMENDLFYHNHQSESSKIAVQSSVLQNFGWSLFSEVSFLQKHPANMHKLTRAVTFSKNLCN